MLLAAFALLAPASQAATAGCDASRVDKAAGVARSLSGCGKADLARGPEGAARQALGRVSGALGVRRDTRDLGLMRKTSTGGGPRLRFQQFVGGVPVRKGQIAVALGKDGKVLHVGSGAVSDTTLDTTPSVSRADALRTARRRVPGGFDTVVPARTQLIAEPSARGTLRLAWHVTLAARKPRGDWNVIVSATSGDVLKAWDAIVRVNGSALTYSPNPVQMTGNTNLRDIGDSDQSALTTARAPFTLTDLDPAPETRLRGTFANAAPSVDPLHCVSGYVPGEAQASNPARDYTTYLRSQNAFEEVQAYLALTRVQQLYEGLGFDIFSSPVRINVHCDGEDNSFFSPSDDGLHMGDGGVDDAEDSDVTVHEFGHATQDAQVPGFGPGGPDTEQRAMGEGFGDFLATYTYLQDGNATYQANRRFCVMEWDATAYNPVVAGNGGSGCLRWVNGRNENDGSDIGTYPGAPQEEHDDGRYWSAMLTCVFQGIEPSLGTAAARDRMLTLVLAHHEDLVPTDDDFAFADSLDALRAEDQARFGGNEVPLIDRCGEQRLGIGTPPAVSGSLSPSQPDGANGWYRSVPSVAWSVSDPESAIVSSNCPTGVPTSDSTAQTLSCSATSAGGTTMRTLTYRRDATPPQLAPRLSVARPRAGQSVRASANASDATSGVAAQACDTPDTSTPGRKSVACAATDVAGNQTARSFAYRVGGTGFKISKVRVSRTGTVTFRLRATRSVRVRIRAKSAKVKFRTQSKRLTKNRNIKVTLKLTATQRAAFVRKLRTGRRQKVVVTLKPTGEKLLKRTLRVRRR